MRKWKWLKRLFSVATVLLMVFALAPVKVQAQVQESIYYSADGINIYIDTGDPLGEGKTAHFTVLVDGATVTKKTVEGLPATAGGYYIQAPGYNVSFDGVLESKQDSIDQYHLTFGAAQEHNVTINLTKSNKISDAIVLGDYGTFCWQKGEATHDDFERQVSVYVNGASEPADTFKIYTPQQLYNSLGSNAQYWFEPSGSYNAEYRFDPPYTLDMVANQNLAIYLTTKCPCGNQYCECPGGADCTCVEGCTCELCNPMQGENEIRTPYGTIDYKSPSGEGYNLTVEIYVNGELKRTTDQLRIRSSELDCLNFEPARGYYYFNDENSYDLVTSGDSSWNQNNGWIHIVGGRDDDNRLKIYLWTFANHSSLDVDRSVSVNDNVTGYVISYDAYDPETEETRTYTYEATSFLAAQSQMIPSNTDVTITAICNSPYEVSQWSTEDAYSAVQFSGRDGQQGREAYGNSATLKVTSTAYTDVLVYIDELRDVQVPTEEELINNPDLYFADGKAVIVDCVTNDEHDNGTYGLKENTFTVSRIQGGSASGYYATITITDPSAYIDEYSKTIGLTHERQDSDEKSIRIEYQGYKDGKYVWAATGPATYNVECKTTTDQPDKPTVEEIEDLLVDGAVTIDCINNEAGHEDKIYTPIADSYTIGKVVKNEDTEVYTSAITFNNKEYVDSYNTDVALGHTLNDGEEASKAINFVWNADGQKWEVESNGSPVTFKVICENGGGEEPGTEDPDKPTLEEIDELLPDTLVSVDCITDENHADQTYNLIESAITIGDVEGDADERYTSTVTFAAKGYVEQYSTDMKKDHTLADGQPTEHKLVFVWDAANQKWQLSIGTVTQLVFQVECDTTTEPGTDEPGAEDPENPDDEKPGDDQQGTENPDDQKPGDQDGQGTGDKTDGSQDGDKNGGADSGKQDSTKGDGTKTSASLGVSLFGSLASVSATGAAILSVLRRKRR